MVVKKEAENESTPPISKFKCKFDAPMVPMIDHKDTWYANPSRESLQPIVELVNLFLKLCSLLEVVVIDGLLHSILLVI